MHADFSFQMASFAAFLWALARVSGIVAVVPIPGFSAGPDASKIVLALALTLALFPVWGTRLESADNAAVTVTLSQLAGGVLRESFFGVSVGLAVAFLLEGVQLAAQAVGLQAGYSYASTVDPSTQADTTTLQLMAQLLAGALFFVFGFDRIVLRTLARSFQAPPGASFWQGKATEEIAHLGAGIFTTGLQLAMPVLALLVLLDIAFAVFGRLHAQLQLLSLAFAVKMLAALAFLASILAMYPGVFERAGVQVFSVLDRILGG